MYCTKCGAPNGDDKAYCKMCGAPLKKVKKDDSAGAWTQQQDSNEWNRSGQGNSGQKEGFAPFPSPAPAPVQSPVSNMDTTPITMWGYFGYELLFSIPVVGFILLLVFSFGGTRNQNLKNFARSYFCLAIVLVVFALLLVMLGGGMMSGRRSYYY